MKPMPHKATFNFSNLSPQTSSPGLEGSLTLPTISSGWRRVRVMSKKLPGVVLKGPSHLTTHLLLYFQLITVKECACISQLGLPKENAIDWVT